MDTPSSSVEEMNIKIKTLEPATYELKIPMQANVADLKQRLVEVASIPQDRQRIIYKGRVLENDQQLQAHGVQEGHTLHLVQKASNAPAPTTNQASEQTSQRDIPAAFGSLELDSDETDVNALLASIFQQLGGPGHVAGFVGGEGGNAPGGDNQQRRTQEAQFIAQQLMESMGGQAMQDANMQAFPGAPGERRPNMLASIQAYLDKLQELMQNPSVLLPSVSYPPGQEHELHEQQRLLEAVRGVLTPAVRSRLGREQQAFLEADASWQPPPPAAGSSARHGTASRTAAAQAAVPTQPSTSTSAAAAAAAHAGSAAPPSASSTPRAATESSRQAAAGNASGFIGSAVPRQSAMAAAPAVNTGAGSSVAATAHPSAAPPASSAAQGISPQAQPFGSPVQPHDDASQAQNASGGTREAGASRNADGTRRRRTRRPAAISPVVTMALGSLLQTTLAGDAYQDPANVLDNAANLLATTHSFEGTGRQPILDSLRSAGSHMYRLAPLLMELARACSAAVAAMQGDAGPLVFGTAQYIRPDGSRPAIGYSPGNVHQIVGSTMNIPFFTGTQIGGMQMGPGVVGPTMAGPAPAANGPAPATTGNRGGNAAGAAAAAGAAGAAGGAAGAGTGRGGPTGLNLGSLLQSAFGGAGGHPGQPNRPGVSIGESRQLIQVPGAPPVSIRFGAGQAGSLPPGQQGVANMPVTLQVGNGTPIDLAPIIRSLGSTLGSAIESAVATANPATAPPASATPAPAGSGQTAQPAPASLLTSPVMQHIMRAILHSISPLVSPQIPPASGPSTGTARTQAGTSPHPSMASASVPGTGTSANGSAAPAPTSDGPTTQLALSDPLEAMIGGLNPSMGEAAGADSGVYVGAMDSQGLIDALMQAGASSVNVQGPFAAPGGQPGNPTPPQPTESVNASANAATSPAAEVPSAAASPEQRLVAAQADAGAGLSSSSPFTQSEAESPPASATDASSAPGVVKPAGRGAVGLGSTALPPRDKASKKAHPRSPVPGSVSGVADQPSSSRQSPGSRPAPSQPQQDNVKRARRGGSPGTQAPPQTATAGPHPATAGPRVAKSEPQGATAAQPVATASRGEAVEEIAEASRGTMQAGGGRGLEAMMAGMFGGSGGGGSGGLDMGSLMQAAGQLMSDPQVSQGVTGMIESLGQQAGGRAGQSGQSPQRDGGPDAIGGGLGAILQGLGPMMQQLAVGASGQPQGGRPQGTVGTADGSGSSNDWKAALSELDAEEKAEWERIIRADMTEQAERAPDKYKDHSTAYLAGKPPAASSMLLPGGNTSIDNKGSD